MALANFKKKYDKTELLNALQMVLPGIAKKKIVEQSSHFMFQGDKIITFNDEVAVSCPLDTGFNLSVPSDKLFSLLKKMNTKEISMELSDGNLKIIGGKTKAFLSGMEEGTVIETMTKEIGELSEDSYQDIPEGFLEAIQICAVTASSDMSNRWATCVIVDENFVWSNGDYEITYVVLDENVDIGTMLIPATSVKLMKNFDIVEFQANDSWVHFRTKDGVVFSSRLVMGEDYDSNFTEKFEIEGKSFTLPENISEMLERSGIINDHELEIDREVKVSIKENKIICRSHSSGVGWIEEEEEIDYQGEPITFITSPSFFIEASKKTFDVIIADDKTKALFEVDNIHHLIGLHLEEE